MYANPCGTCESDGLGLWGALIPVGTSIIGGLLDGGGDYYSAAVAGQLLCPGPYDIGEVANAIANLDSSPEGSRLRQRILSQFSLSDKATAATRGATPTGQAGVLVNWAHGGTNCPEMSSSDYSAVRLVDDILAAEAERQRTLRARAEAAAETVVGTVVGGTTEFFQAEIVPGVSTPLLALGALGLVGAFFFRR